MEVLALAIAGLSFLVGVRASIGSFRDPAPRDIRFLVAVHDAARGAFWFSLGGVFLLFALAENPRDFQFLAIVPIVLAGIRMLAAARLSRR